MTVRRIERETRTVRLMIGIYCRRHHSSRPRSAAGVCPECEALAEYASARLARCPFGDRKTVCRDCRVHCYRPDMRERIRQVMRYAGPRMIFHHPLAAIRHLLGR